MAAQRILEATATVKNPLREVNGVLRVGQTRVSFDSIIEDYHSGSSPEEICLHYPSVSIEHVYSTISLYLQNQKTADEYLSLRATESESIETRHRELFNTGALRERLLQRRSNGV